VISVKLRATSRTALFSWLFVCALVAVCITLGIYQYRWISEVSLTARDHMRDDLRSRLSRFSRDFNSEIAAASSSLARFSGAGDAQTVAAQFAPRFAQWKTTSRHPRLFDGLALAIPSPQGVSLQTLNLDRGVLAPAEWPADWEAAHARIEGQTANQEDGRGPGPPPEPGPRRAVESEGLTFDLPVSGASPDARWSPRRFPPREREVAWVVFHLNLAYLRGTMLPELLRRDLGSNGDLDYEVEIVARDNPDSVIFDSDSRRASPIFESADASIGLFDPLTASFSRRGEPFGPAFGPRAVGRGRGPDGPGRGPDDMGRWRMYVQHRAGSLEAVVEQARFRNLSVTAGVLLLMLATAFALLRYTLRAQRLANMQMDFVAGVSHELRTPLTVIHTAGYNLRGKLAQNPAQVEQYGAMIQRESERLRGLVEQVLQFASAGAGRVVQEREPLSVAHVIEEAVEASRSALDDPAWVMESNVDTGLPPVMGDSKALRRALENLVGNAVKYGKPGHWIGVFASKAEGDSSSVEIRVADRGPGIPEHEQRRIFDPFFRGARARQDQIHGTGLGLSLVKKIVEAHGGSIRVESAPMRGTAFILRIPAAPEAAR